MRADIKHWQLDHDDNKVAWLTLDKADSSTNVLSSEVLEELDLVLGQLEKDLPKALIIKSGKSSGFCAGADVEEFTLIKDYDQAYTHIRRAQAIFDRLENLACPSLCVINGFCLGGGLELALACHYRIAEESVSTRIGLPEVKLGIHPGYAGSVRLTHLIGAPAAMQMILTGRTVSGKQAARSGIVSHAVPARLLDSSAAEFIHRLPSRPKAHGWRRLTNSVLFRPLLAKVFMSNLNKKTRREHYPAPYAQVEIWRRYGGNIKAMKNAEAESVARLVVSPIAQNLIRLFFLQNRLKETAKQTDFKAQHVHVIGAGIMGGDIAAWCSLRGLKVTLQDRDTQSMAPAIKRANKLFKKKLRVKHEIQHAHDRLIPDVNGNGVYGADVIIEAIYEDLDAKQKLFSTVEQNARPEAVLASNTSSLRLESIAESMQDPSRLVGIHFFNPVAQMLLVEIVSSQQTDVQSVLQASAFTKQISKLPLPVKSSPGFLVNRVLMPYLLEAVTAYEEGISGPVIDQAARNFGMPMGPIELADTVGLDICLHAAEILSAELGGEVPTVLRTLVDKGNLGKKTGEGFYRYCKGKNCVEKVKGNKIPADLTDRLILRLINEAMQCLHEGIIDDPDLIDAGIVFGTGFAPFHGGPMQYAATLGTPQIRNLLKKYETQYGARFKASLGW
jgi:3-hydroxyacyl-CoA dehydrogenase/enoyl-CoA hydratase/3-hydroxybutyryl-CoA epimerase